ncbi:MAG: penicillin-binding protein 2 [Rickettsiales bacterium]|nr:penicillin-binding protein 2 [Rickettsiales bacterium]
MSARAASKRAPSRIKVDGVLKHALESSRQRLLFVGLAVCLAFSGVCVRAVQLAFADVESFVQHQYSHSTVPAISRANIMDRNRVLLATNLETLSLYANPRIILDMDEAVNGLAKTFPEFSKEELRKKLDSSRSFVWIKRNLTPQEQYDVNNLGIPGLLFEREEKRVYPHGPLLAHTLGFVDIDGNGIAGMEKGLDYTLSTQQENESPVTLALDVRIQSATHEALKQSIKKFKAQGGAAVVMDVHTGEVLSMISLPDFDPNNPEVKNKDAMFNRATVGLYEMGSTFKIFNTAMALDENIVKLSSKFDVTKPIRIARFTISDYHPLKYAATVPEIFMHSSNIGSAKIAMEAGAAEQQKFLGKIGLLSPLEMELPEKASPLTPDRWGDISTMTVSFGHGISVSLMHVAAAVSSMVNGGIYRSPSFIHNANHLEGKRVIRQETSDIIRRLVRLVVTDGTGTKADVEGYMVGGKTGTAEKPVDGRYSKNAHITSFAGAFPMNDPKVVVVVMLDDPQGLKETWNFATAGWNAAPTAAAIIRRIGPVLGISPVDESSPEIAKAMHVDYVRKDK